MSNTAVEVLDFLEEFDAAYFIWTEMGDSLGIEVAIVMVTDSEILFNKIARQCTTMEKSFTIGLKATRAAYADKKISNILIG